MKKIIVASLISIMAFGAVAEDRAYRLPASHALNHDKLLADQGNAGISVENTSKYLETLFNEEEEPEFDLYTEGWNSKHVNCYSNSVVPNSAKIDVSNFAMPHPGYLTSPYGYRRRFRRMHKGVDLKLNIGDTVRSSFDGRVRIVNYERKGYGKYIVVRHTNDLETVYGHLSDYIVKEGDYVKAGDPIGLGGNTGRSTGPHLHFETRYMGYAINPCAIFDFANQTTHTDIYTFDKRTYQDARNFDPDANRSYASQYLKENPTKPYAKSKSKDKDSKKSTNSFYRVRKGDTLGKIASRNNTTVKALCKLNGIKANTTLQLNQRLKVR